MKPERLTAAQIAALTEEQRRERYAGQCVPWYPPLVEAAEDLVAARIRWQRTSDALGAEERFAARLWQTDPDRAEAEREDPESGYRKAQAAHDESEAAIRSVHDALALLAAHLVEHDPLLLDKHTRDQENRDAVAEYLARLLSS